MKLRTAFTIAIAAAALATATPGWGASSDPQAKGPVFSDPYQIFNPFLPLTALSQDILMGVRGNLTAETIRTRLQGSKQFVIDGQVVQAMIVEDDNYEGGQLIEVTQDHFVEDDDGNVYYMGEDSTHYKNGQVVGHAGSWLYGVDTTNLGTLMPGHPRKGQKWMSENIPNKNIVEHDQAVSVTASISVPAGTFFNCIQVQESVAGEGNEYKWYCPSVGVVMEYTSDTDYVALVSHSSNWTLP